MLDFMRWVLNVFLAVFFGWAALDRFYEGDRFMAVFKLITFWGCAGIACGASYLLNNVEMGLGAGEEWGEKGGWEESGGWRVVGLFG